MAIDYNVRANYVTVIAIFFCSTSAIFLLIMLRPLYKFSKERTALLILFSKTIASILYQFLQIYMYIYPKFPNFSQLFWSSFFVSPVSCVLTTSIYVHIIGLALNRFHAVLFPFSYQRIWKTRKIKYIILIIWIINFIWGAEKYVGLNVLKVYTGFVSIFTFAIISPGDQPVIAAILISTPLYVAVLAKFIYDYKNNKTETVEAKTHKERIRILIVCLVSLIPCPLYVGVYRLANFITTINEDNTFVSIISGSLLNTSVNLLQCIEEICLVIISKDFRKLVKRQFVKNTTTNVVATTIFVSQNPHQASIVQLNGQRNN